MKTAKNQRLFNAFLLPGGLHPDVHPASPETRLGEAERSEKPSRGRDGDGGRVFKQSGEFILLITIYLLFFYFFNYDMRRAQYDLLKILEHTRKRLFFYFGKKVWESLFETSVGRKSWQPAICMPVRIASHGLRDVKQSWKDHCGINGKTLRVT